MVSCQGMYHSVFIGLLCCFLLRSGAAQDGVWTTHRHMPTKRQEMPSAVIDGKIYVTGGIILASTNKTEIYDIAGDSWSLGPPMPDSRHHHAMAAVDGKLIVVGGYKNVLDFDARDNTWLFDPAAGIWEEKAPIPFSTGACAAVEYQGMLYVFGGDNDSGNLNTAFRYDPAQDEWQELAPMPTTRQHLAAAVIDTLIYVVGGRGSADAAYALEAYSPSTDSWTILDGMPTGRSGLAAGALNGRLYAFGGEGGGLHDEVEEYNPATDSWRILPPMLTPRHGITATLAGDELFLIGGAVFEGYGPTNTVESFSVDAVTGSPPWQPKWPAQAYIDPTGAVAWHFEMPEEAILGMRVMDMEGKVLFNSETRRFLPGLQQWYSPALAWPSGMVIGQLMTPDGIISRRLFHR